MSNWYNNEIEITGPSYQVDNALKFIINDKGEVDFSLAAPLPEGTEHSSDNLTTWGTYSNAVHSKKIDDNKFYFATKNDWPRRWLLMLRGVLEDQGIEVSGKMITAEGGAMVGHVIRISPRLPLSVTP